MRTTPARRPEAPVRFKLPELPESVRHAIEFDTETLAMRDTTLERTPDGIYVTVTNGFSAVLFPTPACPAVVQLTDPPPAKPGGALELELAAFAPWRESERATRVRVQVLGITDQPVEVELPGAVTIAVPDDAEPGNYILRVTGNCLETKRWIRVKN